MKSLSLYIDKWFITVAVNIDGNVIPLTLPNGEDRVWLFFHEVFGDLDAVKLRSSMTLFDVVRPNGIFNKVLDKFFEGKRCERTLKLLQSQIRTEKTFE